MSQVIMEKILALIRKNDPLISDVMWPCHLLPVLVTILPSDYPGHGNCFCCIIVIPTLHHIWPHWATHCLWNAVVTATTFDSYYLLSRAVWLRLSNTSPDGGAAPSSLSPTGRSRCHLLRETDDRNGFISALRRLCNVITLMWFILAFRHADHRPAPTSQHQTLLLLTRHRHKHQTSQPDNNLKPNESNILSCSLQQGKGKSEATAKKSVTRCKSSVQSHHLHITSSRAGNYNTLLRVLSVVEKTLTRL